MMETEPMLQSLLGKLFHYATANGVDEALLYVSVQGFWGNCHQNVFFDARGFFIYHHTAVIV